MKNELHPEQCLIRLCRFCKHPMNQAKYENDDENRWYTFTCIECGYYTIIGEPINNIFTDEDFYSEEIDDSLEHEPLCDDESYQNNFNGTEFACDRDDVQNAKNKI